MSIGRHAGQEERAQVHHWTTDEIEYFNRNYGFVPIEEICSRVKITKHQAHSKAGRLGLTRRAICRTCGKQFVGFGKRGKKFYCSHQCIRKSQTRQHYQYVLKNREHIKAYSKARKLRLWGLSDDEIAASAESFALKTILPRLGFTNLFHCSKANRFFPFDIVATYNGRRVLVDVTTGASKTLGSAGRGIGEALGMPVYVLFVKPDFTKYQLSEWHGTKSVAIHIPELIELE